MDKEDKIRQMREESRNELESYIYSSRDITFESKFEPFSTMEEREKLSKALSEASEWMEDHEIDGTREEFSGKLKTLKSMADPIFLRSKEDILRPLAVSEFEEIIRKCKEMMKGLNESLEEGSSLKIRFDKYAKLVELSDAWYSTTSKSQSELTVLQDPVLLSSDLKERITMLQTAYDSLKKIQDAQEYEAKRKQKEEAKKKSKVSTETPEAQHTKAEGDEDIATDDIDTSVEKESDEDLPVKDQDSHDDKTVKDQESDSEDVEDHVDL